MITKTGDYFIFNFFYRSSHAQARLHIDDLDMLLFLQKTLALGRVEKKVNRATFIVNKKTEIKKKLSIYFLTVTLTLINT